MPAFVEPMLPTPIKLPFTDPQWLFEPKWAVVVIAASLVPETSLIDQQHQLLERRLIAPTQSCKSLVTSFAADVIRDFTRDLRTSR